ncbi:hypothetical protein REPUB_Repub10bG0056300 [Reevesia pubescens]
MGRPHILVIPYPAQGHVIPLMELSQNLAKKGFKISFINTEFNHKRIVDAFGNKPFDENGLIHLVSIPDGMEHGKDRNQLGKLSESLCQVMPRELKEFTAELGIRTAAFWPASLYQLVALLSIPKLIDDGLIDENGTVINEHKIFELSPTMPAIHPKNFVWVSLGDSTTQKFMFHFLKGNNKTVETADWVLCNSSLDLEAEGFTLVPKVLPIGPLSASNRLGNFSGNFWPEDTTCLQWLDQQPPGSVVYVAFGSFTIFDQIQFQELAFGLELTKRPFLWVVRPDTIPRENRMLIQKDSRKDHCGWNSTIEGISNGVPFLCWPYFVDQFLNETYIYDIWKVGLKFERDERGIITKEEIKTKVEKLLGDKKFKRKAVELKEMVAKSVNEGGSSDSTFKKFVEWIKS